jgi:hypothetical protein
LAARFTNAKRPSISAHHTIPPQHLPELAGWCAWLANVPELAGWCGPHGAEPTDGGLAAGIGRGLGRVEGHEPEPVDTTPDTRHEASGHTPTGLGHPLDLPEPRSRMTVASLMAPCTEKT